MQHRHRKPQKPSLNHVFRLVWSHSKQMFIAVAEICTAKGKSKSGVIGAVGALALGFAGTAHALDPGVLPVGADIQAGQITISLQQNVMDINQTSQKGIINWQTFSIGKDATVNFHHMNASASTLNRVVGNETSLIHGVLNANGQVFLLNSNGILIGKDAQVNVGALVASTLDITNQDFLDGHYTFHENGSQGSVINLGTIQTADEGYVALLGQQVINEGIITARMGAAVMAAGDRISLNFNGDSLIGVTVEKGTLDALVANHHAVIADGGLVIMTAKGLDEVMATVVNNTGEVRARTIEEREGRIFLLGGMENDRIEVAGTLDASASEGANGGFIETSAANVQIREGLEVSTKADSGQTGQWLIDPTDIYIISGANEPTQLPDGSNSNAGDPVSSNIHASTINAALETTNVTITTASDGAGAGDINVNAALNWFSENSLTLNANQDININAAINSFDGDLIMNADRNVHLDDNIQVRLIAGDLRIDAGGDITQGEGSVYRVGGTTTLNATDAVNLNQNGNRLAGAVNIDAVSLVLNNFDPIKIGNTNITGNASFTSSGIITGLNGSTLSIGGDATFSTTANNANISLQGNTNITGTTRFNANGTGNISVTGATGNLNLGTTNTDGKIEITGAGDIKIVEAIGTTGAGQSGLIKIESTAGSVILEEEIVTKGGNVRLTAHNEVTSTADGSITTTANENTGQASGSVIIAGAGGVNLQAEIVTTGAAHELDVASNAASVSVTSADGNVRVVDITTSGGASTSTDQSRNGGNAGTITLGAENGTVFLDGDLRALGGSGSGSSPAGLGGLITLQNQTVLTGDRLIDTGGTSGDIVAESTIDSDGNGLHALTLNAGTGNITLKGKLGETERLGQVTIQAADVVRVEETVKAVGLQQLAGRISTTLFKEVDALGGGVDILAASIKTENDAHITSEGDVTLVADLAVDIGGDITTENSDILISGAVTGTKLNQDVVFSTGLGAGDITFQGRFLLGSVDADTQQKTNLTLRAGQGDIKFTLAENTNDIGQLFIDGARDVTQGGFIIAEDLKILNARDVTLINGRNRFNTLSGLSTNGDNDKPGDARIFNEMSWRVEDDIFVDGFLELNTFGTLDLQDFDINSEGAFLRGGLTQTSDSEINVGAGKLEINGVDRGGPHREITMAGSIVSSNTADDAIGIHAAANAQLGNIDVINGGLTFVHAGTGAVTQTDGSVIKAAKVTGHHHGTLTLANANEIAQFSSLSANGTINLNSVIATSISGITALTGNVLIRATKPGVDPAASAGNLTLSGNITAANGNITLVADNTFTNAAGVNPFSVQADRSWRVWSQRLADDTLGELIPNFIQFNASYDDSPAVLGTGNGFLYASPSGVTATLTGSTEKTYDGNQTVTNSNGINVDFDWIGGAVALGTTITGYEFTDANAGEDKTVNAIFEGGVTADNAIWTTNDAQTRLYGLELGGSLSGDIGTINQRELTLDGSFTAENREYDGTTDASILQNNLILSGLVDGENL
ncbi:two-partner secretion domain-containing protein, partial [Nitrincola alkalisediminis]